MQNFNDWQNTAKKPIEEKKHFEKDPSNLHCIVLGLGEEEGTFADIVGKLAKKKGMKFTLINVDEAYISSVDVDLGSVVFQNYDGEDGEIELSKENSIVFVRAGAIQNLTSQSLVSSLGTYGFFMVNDLESMMLCDNKMSNVIALDRNNIPTPKSSVITNVKSIESAHEKIGGKFPVVIKTLTGTQGVGVAIAESKQSLVSVCQALWKYDAQLLIQEYLPLKSDIRTLVVNGKIVGSAERVKQDDKEFRNNVHLGAKTLPYKLSDEEIKLVKQAARATGALYCGVDHCKVGKNNYVLEINGSPGIRSHFNAYDLETEKSLGKVNDEDILNTIITYFTHELHRKPLFRTESGYIERIELDGLEQPIRAKFDTGNGTDASMLHVDSLDIDGDTAIWEKNKQKFKSNITDVSIARRLPTIKEKRPVIELTIHFNNKSYPNTRIALSTTDTASEMLINRDLISTFKVSVNPNRRFVLSDHVGKEDNTDT